MKTSRFKRNVAAPHERRPKLPTRSDAVGGGGPPRRPLLLQTRFLVLVGLLVALLVAGRVNRPDPSVTVPYSPVFLDEVRDGNVERINSRGAGVTGVFRTAVTWPRGGEERPRFSRSREDRPKFDRPRERSDRGGDRGRPAGRT